jgi:hypothetical protein
MQNEDIELLKIKVKYDEIVQEAIRRGIGVFGPLDPKAVACGSGTRCCAGDGRYRHRQDLVSSIVRTELVR